jgi:pyruvate kinase
MAPRIIATIGPASLGRATLKAMSAGGMDIAQINTKYGSVKQYGTIVKNLSGLGCGIMFDIKRNIGKEKADWMLRQEFEYLALSFAESREHVVQARRRFPGKKIISKIETMKGIDNIDSLIRASDGIMVARGDLGKNIPFERVPIMQKIIITKCLQKKKFVVTATEMLLSMVKSRVPERSEASDVANAVLDGSSALMLSEETAIGAHPVLVIKTMKKIIDYTCEHMDLLKSRSSSAHG